jgi:hypothetical protein
MTAASATTGISWAKIVKSHLDQNPQSEIVIEFTTTAAAVPTALTSSPPQENKYNQEVDVIAKEIAIKFYEQCQTQFQGIVRRSELEKLFNNTFPNSEIEFPVVLFALAKGLKCVNVFNRGQDLQWFPLSKTQLNRIKRSMKQPVQATDGWTAVGAVAAAQIQKPEKTQQEIKAVVVPEPAEPAAATQQPKPDFTINSNDVDVPTFPDTPEQQPISTEELIQLISGLRGEIKDIDTEIESLIVFHREHLREMNRVKTINDQQLGNDLYSFHNRMRTYHEEVLDDLQLEISRKREKLAKLCDLLKQ